MHPSKLIMHGLSTCVDCISSHVRRRRVHLGKEMCRKRKIGLRMEKGTVMNECRPSSNFRFLHFFLPLFLAVTADRASFVRWRGMALPRLPPTICSPAESENRHLRRRSSRVRNFFFGPACSRKLEMRFGEIPPRPLRRGQSHSAVFWARAMKAG